MSYTLEIQGAGAAFHVTRVEGKEKIHAAFAFDVTCGVPEGVELDAEALLAADAELSSVVEAGGEPVRTVRGVVDTVELDGPELRVTIVPPVALLADTSDHQVFTDVTAVEIVEQVLGEHGI